MINYNEGLNHHGKAIRVLQERFGEQEIVGIEIGTAEGLLTKALLGQLPNLKMIYAIDPYRFTKNAGFEEGMYDQAWHDDRKAQAVKALAEYPGRYTHLCMSSDLAAAQTPDAVDFVWVDGGHEAPQIVSDIKNYYPKVKSGCIFGGHDWDKAIHPVKDHLKEDVTLGPDLTWWIIKI